MQPDNKYTDDMDYLSGLGFEQVAASAADVGDLVKKVRARSFSYNSGLYFTFISLLVGVFIGVSLFFALPDTAAATALPGIRQAPGASPLPMAEAIAGPVILDTITIVKENFINPQVKAAPLQAEAMQPGAPRAVDSVVSSIPGRPIDMALLNPGPVKEERLKFMLNAPVVYIHDMKVTNYATLYFKKNHFVKFTGRSGVTAEYPTRSASFQSAPHLLDESVNYFLHEEIAQGLLYFKNGKYDDCINSLRLVAEYNADDLNCDFYTAMSYYYKGNYTMAAALFDQCTGNLNNTFLQEAMYYKAVSLYESGNKNEAAALLRQIADDGEFYASKAKAYLK